jgi:hypothetical protein
MTLRDLTDEQRIDLVNKSEHWYKERAKQQHYKLPLDSIAFMIGFSDGVRVILNLIDKLP